MRKYKLLDGYKLTQKVEGDGIVNLVVKKIDGSEDDVIVGQVIDGKYVIPGDDRELGREAKLVYESKETTGEDPMPSLVYASYTKLPNGMDVDYDILGMSNLSQFITWTNAEDSSTDEFAPLAASVEIEKASDEPEETKTTKKRSKKVSE